MRDNLTPWSAVDIDQLRHQLEETRTSQIKAASHTLGVILECDRKQDRTCIDCGYIRCSCPLLKKVQRTVDKLTPPETLAFKKFDLAQLSAELKRRGLERFYLLKHDTHVDVKIHIEGQEITCSIGYDERKTIQSMGRTILRRANICPECRARHGIVVGEIHYKICNACLGPGWALNSNGEALFEDEHQALVGTVGWNSDSQSWVASCYGSKNRSPSFRIAAKWLKDQLLTLRKPEAFQKFDLDLLRDQLKQLGLEKYVIRKDHGEATVQLFLSTHKVVVRVRDDEWESAEQMARLILTRSNVCQCCKTRPGLRTEGAANYHICSVCLGTGWAINTRESEAVLETPQRQMVGIITWDEDSQRWVATNDYGDKQQDRDFPVLAQWLKDQLLHPRKREGCDYCLLGDGDHEISCVRPRDVL